MIAWLYGPRAAGACSLDTARLVIEQVSLYEPLNALVIVGGRPLPGRSGVSQLWMSATPAGIALRVF